jgi:hypothetical protein
VSNFREVLYWVNSVRFDEFQLGPIEKLPDGIPSAADKCSLARCFPKGCLVDGTLLYRPDCTTRDMKEGNGIELPEIVRDFASRFDSWDYPELVEQHGEDES